MTPRFGPVRAVLCMSLTAVLTASSSADGSIPPCLVIDPGHGGPTDTGGCHALTGFYEKTANLNVALRLADTLSNAAFGGYVKGQDYFLTREVDVAMTRPQRAAFANNRYAQQFISIHHNAVGGCPVTSNYTRVYYCTAALTDSGWFRDTSAVLASKVGHRIVQEFKLNYSQCSSVSWPCMDYFDVLRLTKMRSVLTEASFVANTEESYRLRDSSRAEQEAGAIAHGWRSYVDERGFAIVRNAYNGGNEGDIWVDDVPWDSPFLAVWEHEESHALEAAVTQWFPDGYQGSFFRWVSVADYQYPRDSIRNTVWYNSWFPITVGGEWIYHIWVAFFSGGPYNASVASPYDTVYVTDTVPFVWRPTATVSSARDTINWHADVGADSTSVIRISLDRNGGSGGYAETILGPGYFDQLSGRRWLSSGPGTSNAKLRITANDYAGNSKTAYSTYPFVIYDCGQLAVTNETMSSNKPAITELYLDYDCNVNHNLDLTVYRLDGDVWTEVAGWCQEATTGHTHIAWPIDPAHQGQYLTYRMAGECTRQCGSSGAWLSDQFSVDLQLVNTPPEFLQGPFFVGRNCLEYGTWYDVRVLALDAEDGKSLTYRWTADIGYFAPGAHTITTSAPAATYRGPVNDTCVPVKKAPDDEIHITVYDAQGGSSTRGMHVYLECQGDCPQQAKDEGRLKTGVAGAGFAGVECA